jgi:hypothetical protein
MSKSHSPVNINFKVSRSFILSILPIFVLLVSSPVLAQDYVPLGKPAPDLRGESSIGRTIRQLLNINTIVGGAAAASPVFPECTPIPTSVAGAYQYHQRLLTTTEALSLGIPVANISGSGSKMVLVQDYAKAKECPATDNQNVVLYGHTIRTVITVSDWNAKIGTSIPVIAADATINKKDHQINIFVLGMENAKIPGIIAQVAGKTFNVENYAKYLEIEQNLIKLAEDNTTQFTIERLGALPRFDESQLRSSSASSFALHQIRDGRTCEQAKADFRAQGDPAAAAIIRAYEVVTGECGVKPVTSGQKEKADSLLFKLKVKY